MRQATSATSWIGPKILRKQHHHATVNGECNANIGGQSNTSEREKEILVEWATPNKSYKRLVMACPTLTVMKERREMVKSKTPRDRYHHHQVMSATAFGQRTPTCLSILHSINVVRFARSLPREMFAARR